MGAREETSQVVAVVEMSGEHDGKGARLGFERAPAGPVADHPQPGGDAALLHGAERLDGQVGPLLSREPADAHEPDLVVVAVHVDRMLASAGMEHGEVDAERDDRHVARADANELGRRERRRRYHRVEAAREAAVPPVGAHRQREARRHPRREDRVQPLVRDEDGAHAVAGGPCPQPDERELVGHLEVVGRQLGEHGAYAAAPGEGPIAAHARDLRAAQRDAATRGGVLVGVGGSGHDEHSLEPGVDVRAPEGVDGGTESAGVTGVEVGDLQDAGPHRRYAARPAAAGR